MNYTKDNWTVSSLIDTSQIASKNIAIPDIDFATDYVKSSDEPMEAIIANTTGAEIGSAESIRYGSSIVNNIYTAAGVDASQTPANKKGVQTLVEVSTTYRATNTVTGQEIEIPCKGRIVLRFPTNSCVTDALVTDLLTRTIAASFCKGSTGVERQLELARGSVLPDGL